MHYIINPWLFYLFNLFEKLNILFMTLTIISVAVILLFIPWGEYLESIYENKDINKSASIKMLKKVLIVFIISVFGLTLIPDGNTCREILIASYLTEENIEYGKESIKDAIDYIFEKIENKEETNE